MEDVKINVKIKLSALWVVVMLCYLYGDVFGFFELGFIEEVIAGAPRGMPTTQESLLVTAILMAIPSFMVFLSLELKAKTNRWANIILGIFYTAVMVITMLMTTYAYYVLLGIVEAVSTALIVWIAWKWPKQEG